MDRESIRNHWQAWASAHGADLKATTRTWTAKSLEVDALRRQFQEINARSRISTVLEVGCGNGINCVELAKSNPSAEFDGLDYIAEMAAAAKENAEKAEVGRRVRFHVGDVLALDSVAGLSPVYDLVFTDRCLINLNTPDLQKKAIATLAGRVRQGGHLLMIENSTLTHGAQNRCREALGLEARKPAAFNLFFDEDVIRPHLAQCNLSIIEVEDFSSLHDLVLYVLLPSVSDGKLDYDHPLVDAAAKLSAFVSAGQKGAFGAFGQNRMFVCRKL